MQAAGPGPQSVTPHTLGGRRGCWVRAPLPGVGTEYRQACPPGVSRVPGNPAPQNNTEFPFVFRVRAFFWQIRARVETVISEGGEGRRADLGSLLLTGQAAPELPEHGPAWPTGHWSPSTFRDHHTCPPSVLSSSSRPCSHCPLRRSLWALTRSKGHLSWCTHHPLTHSSPTVTPP